MGVRTSQPAPLRFPAAALGPPGTRQPADRRPAALPARPSAPHVPVRMLPPRVEAPPIPERGQRVTVRNAGAWLGGTVTSVEHSLGVRANQSLTSIRVAYDDDKERPPLEPGDDFRPLGLATSSSTGALRVDSFA